MSYFFFFGKNKIETYGFRKKVFAEERIVIFPPFMDVN